MRTRICIMVGTMLLVLSGCGSGGLTQDDVTNLPDGNATGTAYTGTYQLELITKSCSGKCYIEYQNLPVSFCDVSDKESANITVTQSEGHVQVEADEGDLQVTLLEGGINTDGSFTVGGYATQYGGQLKVASKATGTITTDGNFQGEAETHLWGSGEGQSLNCTAQFTLQGFRN